MGMYLSTTVSICPYDTHFGCRPSSNTIATIQSAIAAALEFKHGERPDADMTWIEQPQEEENAGSLPENN